MLSHSINNFVLTIKKDGKIRYLEDQEINVINAFLKLDLS